ncbi:hypothetical protein DL764_006265 [Monosporascus ibericus]|uniref:NAD-dependent epimerase/dehydratase domain-containing protein n=1 Tax=Monosporascus ibericus TaxID=155417 RepID=A0A4Q4T8C9_9PEZI|nr:hypothetical protein DL764_006265 [Monosporascus ibericus]
MSHNILVTGASGYLGGTLLARLGAANLPPYGKLYALVRTDEQAKAVAQYGAEPLRFDTRDENAIRAAVIENNITVIYYLIDAIYSTAQTSFIKALAEVKEKTGQEVHFLHTSGAKVFSSFAGAPTDRPLSDADPQLYDIQKSQRPAIGLVQETINTNCTVVEQGEKNGVRSYVFVPCIVYGKGEGFGNPISIQTVEVVRAAKGAKRVYRVDGDRPAWPVCHVVDNTNLYIELLRRILSGENPGYGKNGYYLAASGSVAWDDLYSAMAKSLAKRNVVTDDSVVLADDEALEKMASALGVPKDFVPLSLGGRCTFTADRGKTIGWNPIYAPEHILEASDAEVELILETLKD